MLSSSSCCLRYSIRLFSPVHHFLASLFPYFSAVRRSVYLSLPDNDDDDGGVLCIENFLFLLSAPLWLSVPSDDCPAAPFRNAHTPTLLTDRFPVHKILYRSALALKHGVTAQKKKHFFRTENARNP